MAYEQSTKPFYQATGYRINKKPDFQHERKKIVLQRKIQAAAIQVQELRREVRKIENVLHSLDNFGIKASQTARELDQILSKQLRECDRQLQEWQRELDELAKRTD
jgi:predicted lactoylglutathione lyase